MADAPRSERAASVQPVLGSTAMYTTSPLAATGPDLGTAVAASSALDERSPSITLALDVNIIAQPANQAPGDGGRGGRASDVLGEGANGAQMPVAARSTTRGPTGSAHAPVGEVSWHEPTSDQRGPLCASGASSGRPSRGASSQTSFFGGSTPNDGAPSGSARHPHLLSSYDPSARTDDGPAAAKPVSLSSAPTEATATRTAPPRRPM